MPVIRPRTPKPTPKPTKPGKKPKTKANSDPKYYYAPTTIELAAMKRRMNKGTSAALPPAKPGTAVKKPKPKPKPTGVDKTSYSLQSKALNKAYKMGKKLAASNMADLANGPIAGFNNTYSKSAMKSGVSAKQKQLIKPSGMTKDGKNKMYTKADIARMKKYGLTPHSQYMPGFAWGKKTS